jgi:hypothetical protein
LAKKGFLSRFVGADIKKIGLMLFNLDFKASDPATIFPLIDNCPYILDGYHMNGGNIFSLFMTGENLGTLQSVKTSLLKGKGCQQIHFHQIHDGINNLIMPLPMVEQKDRAPCTHTCHTCSHYTDNACLGCPCTQYYRGTLW